MIKIENIGYQYVNVGGLNINRPKGTNNYLFLLLRCHTEVWKEGSYHLLPENTYYLFDKGAPQIYRKTDGHFINDWIHIEIEPYNNYFENLGIPFHTPIVLQDNKPISEMISYMCIEYYDIGEQHDIIMDQKANAMFFKFSDLYKYSQKNGFKKTKYRSDLVNLRRQIQSFQYQSQSADKIAESLGISTSYLEHLYKELFGTSIRQDIIYGRIEYASHLLNSTEHSISEIAEICGYDNFEHFSRQFKKLKGVPPIKYCNRR